MATFRCLLAVLLVHTAFSQHGVPCAFNPTDCTCYNSISDVEYTSASCISRDGPIPQFSGSAGTYIIDTFLNLTFNAYAINDYAFTAFKKIQTLNLIQPPQAQVLDLAWQPHAFSGPTISAIFVVNVAGVLPPPLALQNIGNELLDFEVYNDAAGGPVDLGKNGFVNDANVKTLTIANTPLARIDEYAFGGLDLSLQKLHLRNTSLPYPPSNALLRTRNLYTFDLSDNPNMQFEVADFCALPDFCLLELDTLVLSGNNIPQALDSGALNPTHLPDSLRNLYLDRSSPPLKDIPTVVFQHPFHFNVYLRDNAITTLKVGDFPSLCLVGTLDLSGIPIAEVQEDALGPLTDLLTLVLSKTKLTSFDLSWLNGINEFGTLYLDDLSSLNYLKITDLDKICLPELF